MRTAFWTIVCGLALSACATPLPHRPAALEVARPPEASFQLRAAARAIPATGPQRPLRAGSRWNWAGSLAQGEVFRSDTDPLTIGGGNHYEAWLVLSGDRITGFYLPGERAYVPAANEVTITREYVQ